MQFRVFATGLEIEAENAHEAAKEYFRRLRSEFDDVLIVTEKVLEDETEAFDWADIQEFDRRNLL